HGADRLALAQFEVRDRLARPAHQRLLARDRRQLLDRLVEQLRVLGRHADAHVHHDLLDLRDLVDVLVPELLGELGHHLLPVPLQQSRPHHSTSGASEMIFMKRRARSSRATGPKMRVPTGSRWLSISTAALSSNLMYEPSGRATPLAVRTTTALRTSPFFTRPFGIASFTDTTMTSPIEA